MPFPSIDAAGLDHAARLLSEGKTLKEVCEIVGFGENHVSAKLRARGIVTDHRKGRPAPNRLELDSAAVAAAYLGGESELAIAKRLGIWRPAVHRVLTEVGVTFRGASKANELRMRRLSPEERKELTDAAHEAVRGQKHTLERQERRARSQARIRGFGEPELAAALRARGHGVDEQRPCGKYNIDIAVRAVAVEIYNSKPQRVLSPANRRRLVHIRDAGHAIVVITFYRLEDFIGNLDHVVALVELADRQPAAGRKHWVIRCGAERFARFRDDFGQFAAVPTPVRFFNCVSELDL